MRRLIVLAGSIALLAALVVPALGAGATQIGHDHFTSDPYPDDWCGIQGMSVDRVVANYTVDESGTTMNIRTTFTATDSGKSMEIRQTGLRTESAPIDNGDGTYSIVFTNAGQSPGFRLPTGQVILDTGLIQGVATFNAVNDHFLSFEVVKQAGPRPDACDAIIAALS